MNTPKISLCCAWYNRADYLADTVNSLLSQDYDDFEIILINDGSTDPAVARIMDSFRDPRLTVIHQENAGFVRTLRRAISLARGAYIAIQDAGDVSYPARLRLQAGILDNHPEHVGVSCARQEITVGGPRDGETHIVIPDKRTISTRDLEHNILSPFSHGEVMFRRAAYDATGGYRTAFWFAQDIDLWLRMSDYGTFHILPDILYERRLFADSIQMDVAKIAQQTTLSVFSRQMRKETRKYGFDSVDVFGNHAALFRKRNRFITAHCAKAALKYLYAGNPAHAQLYARCALNEKITALSVTAALIVALIGRHPSRLRLYKKTLDFFVAIQDTKSYT